MIASILNVMNYISKYKVYNQKKFIHDGKKYISYWFKLFLQVQAARFTNISIKLNIYYYTITKSMRALWLVNQLWFIVPENPGKNRASSELLYKSNRPQVFYGL